MWGWKLSKEESYSESVILIEPEEYPEQRISQFSVGVLAEKLLTVLGHLEDKKKDLESKQNDIEKKQKGIANKQNDIENLQKDIETWKAT